jgi:hypothetical protein
MRKNAILVVLFSLAGCLLHGDTPAARAALDFGALWTKPRMLSLLTASPKTKQFSSDEYEKLRAQALMKANLRLGPNIRNPHVSREGLDAGVVGALLQQRTYLERSRTLIASKSTGTKFVNSVATATASCLLPVIRTVNGKGQGAIFTPQPPNNLYRIEGCSFGKVRGQVQLEPHPALPGQSAVPIVLQIDDSLTSWSENEIDVRLDPRLSGIRDSPVTLVIYPGRGQRMELPGCFFVAIRGEPQLLSAIPSSWVKLDPTTARSYALKQLEYVSPPAKGRDVPNSAAGTSAFVIRSDSQPFAVGRDVYDFRSLNPGWVVDSVQLRTYSLLCPGVVTSQQSFGGWDMQWGQRTFAVTLEDDVCISSVAQSLVFSMSLSQYAANVWVIGPVGTQPVPAAFLGKSE